MPSASWPRPLHHGRLGCALPTCRGGIVFRLHLGTAKGDGAEPLPARLDARRRALLGKPSSTHVTEGGFSSVMLPEAGGVNHVLVFLDVLDMFHAFRRVS